MAIEVTKLSLIDPTKYKDGDIFITDRSIAILQNGKVETLVKQNDVQKLIQKEVAKQLKKVTEQ